ncbi:HNH endonuclease signature motif containing protein [Pseudomonas sp. zfem001]|uniref:HNH endonuclease signature motif containing protein n=1 Tax=Pseudomonas sp. zfem001 TaxID=3078196 RepID=UPI002929DBF9|nr:HNH endonuclease signature motif containing protein [Pseudomonas sp. zfem001]MDU9408774.1 HNH endonuclease signature motif containing protein [Pseudomonas sp. zfem001]
MAIAPRAIKKLYALSAGRCNICRTQLFEGDIHIGEMAHVIAKSLLGPRGKSLIESRDSYENLILLCANHHIEVDQNPEKYTTEKLHSIKRNHENFVRTSLSQPEQREDDIASLNTIARFFPLTRLHSYLHYLPSSFEISFFDFGDTIDNFRIDNPHCLPFSDPNLDIEFCKLIRDYSQLKILLSGTYKDTWIYNSHANRPNKAVFNSVGFSCEDKNLLHQEIESSLNCFLSSYQSFISFIRSSYPEVKLDNYQPA